MIINTRLARGTWNTINEHTKVYVDEYGLVRRAMKTDNNGCFVPAYVYRANKRGGYDNIIPCTRRQLRSANVEIF